MPNGMSLNETVFKTDEAYVIQYPYYICDREQTDAESQPLHFNLRIRFDAVIIFKRQRNNQNDGEGISSSLWDGDLQSAEKKIEEQKQAEGCNEAQVPNPLEGVDQQKCREQEHPEHVEELTDERQRGVIERAPDPDDKAGYSDDDRIAKWEATRFFCASHDEHSAEHKRQRRDCVCRLFYRAVGVCRFAKATGLEAGGGLPICPQAGGESHQDDDCGE